MRARYVLQTILFVELFLLLVLNDRLVSLDDIQLQTPAASTLCIFYLWLLFIITSMLSLSVGIVEGFRERVLLNKPRSVIWLTNLGHFLIMYFVFTG